jgi:hypothetical protein
VRSFAIDFENVSHLTAPFAHCWGLRKANSKTTSPKILSGKLNGKVRTPRSRHARAIAGLSLGGYGALKIALRYHDDFAFAASLSGTLNAPQDLGEQRPEFREQLIKAFGPPGARCGPIICFSCCRASA